MKARLQVQTAAARTEFEHAGPVITIGRNPEATLSLEGVGVSWEHARIDLAVRKAALSDLKSTNGTFLNGQPVQGSAPLKVGDTFRLGQEGPKLMVLALELSGAATVPQTAPAGNGAARADKRDLLAVPSLLDVPSREDDEVPSPPVAAKSAKNGKPAPPPVSATRKLLLKAIQQQQTVQTKQKRSLWAVAAVMFALFLLLGGGLWLAHEKLGVFGGRLDDFGKELAGIGDKLDKSNRELTTQMKEHAQFLDKKFVEAANAENERIKKQLETEGKLNDIQKQMAFNLDDLNKKLAKNPAAPAPIPGARSAVPQLPPEPNGANPGVNVPPDAPEPKGPPPVPVPVPVPQPKAVPPQPGPGPGPGANAVPEPANVSFKPGERIDLLMKNSQKYSGSLVYLSGEQVTLLSNPNWPEKPSSYDLRDVQAIQTRDGIFRYSPDVNAFVSATTSYRFNKETATFDRLNHNPSDLYLTENCKISGAKSVNGLMSLGDYGEITLTLPVNPGPATIPAYQFDSLITATNVFLFNKESGKYDVKSHKLIAQEAKDQNDKNWRAFTDERYKRNMEGYEAQTRRVAALSAYWGSRWWWW